MKLNFEKISHMVVHRVGNKLRGEGVSLSNNGIDFKDIKEDLKSLLKKSFKMEEEFRFFYEMSLTLNPVYSIVNKMFESPQNFVDMTVSLAKILYGYMTIPTIKGCEVCFLYLQGCKYNDKLVDGIAILKMSIDDNCIQLKQDGGNLYVERPQVINLSTIEWGCLVLNVCHSEGYKVYVCNKGKKNVSLNVFLTETFLHVEHTINAYNQTSELLTLCNKYLRENPSDVPTQCHFVDRSKEILSNNESISLEDFADNVFEDSVAAKSFKEYAKSKKEAKDIVDKSIDIDHRQLKLKSSFPKRTIHLDNNFDIVVCGNAALLIKGVDKHNNMKYYKVYYEKES